MNEQRVFAMQSAKVYPLYVQKAERKGRTQEEVDQIICWLTGYDPAGLQRQVEQRVDFATFFGQAPALATRGEFRPVIDRVCALDDIVEAHRYVDKGHKRGNVIVAVPQGVPPLPGSD